MAPEAKLASAMVIEGGQVIDRILGGMDWIIGQNVRIMSMSLGLRGFNPAFQTIVDALRAANVLPVIAIGNEGPLTSRSPGNYHNVLSVGAMNANNKVADFSGSQRFDRPVDPLCPDLVAPGVAILSCVPGGLHEEMDGSSMATPHVAGLAALLLQAKPDATAEQLKAILIHANVRPACMKPAPTGACLTPCVRLLRSPATHYQAPPRPRPQRRHFGEPVPDQPAWNGCPSQAERPVQRRPKPTENPPRNERLGGAKEQL